MATVLPAPPGTIYFLKVGGTAFTSPGRPDIPLTPESPVEQPFLLDAGMRTDDGKVLRV